MEKILTEFESKEFLKKYKIPITITKLAKTKAEAVKFARQIGFPVVMKVLSPEIVHKTDAKAVKVNLCNEQAVQKAYDEILKNAKAYNPKAKIHGISVQEMASGKELIIGTSTDPQFGPTIMFGLGGIFVEVMQDVSFRIIPIEKKDAEQMLDEIKGKKILEGVRGEKPLNRNAIINTLLDISKLIQENPDIKEIDLNPIFATHRGIKVADARIVLR
jgi:acyl-CoA synthetase (NDP forming)